MSKRIKIKLSKDVKGGWESAKSLVSFLAGEHVTLSAQVNLISGTLPIILSLLKTAVDFSEGDGFVPQG